MELTGFGKATGNEHAGIEDDTARTLQPAVKAPAADGGGRNWRLLLAALMLLSFACYANSLNNSFVFDDALVISGNPGIRGITNIPRLLGVSTGHVSYRPIRMISYALDYTLNETVWWRLGGCEGPDKGLCPVGYHIANIAYHLLTTLLVFLVVVRLAGTHRAAFLAAALFALHPVHTDSVTYLSGRRDILFTLFYLAGFYFFLRYRQDKKRLAIPASCACYLLSMGSKEMGVTLPLLFLAYDLITHFNHAGGSGSPGYWQALVASAKKCFMQSYALYLLTFLGGLAYGYYKVFITSPSLQFSYYGNSAYITFLTVGRILVHYIKLLLYPVRLNADYSYNAFPLSASWHEPSTMFSFALLLLLGYAALRLTARHKMVAFGMVWFFIALLPVCHIFPHHELLAEHYLYLPSVGFCLAAALAAERALAQGRRSLLITGCLLTVAALFACRIWDRNRDWSNAITMYQKTVTTAPQCARAQNNLGNALARAGRLEGAIASYEQALAVKPAYPDALNNLGIVYLRSGAADEAITTYMKALALTPNHTRVHYNLANAYREKGLFDQAIAAYIKMLQINPGHSPARRNLMDTIARRRELDRKIKAYEQLLAASSADAPLHNNMGELYGRKGMVEKSAFHYEQAMAIDPDYAPAHNNRAWVYATCIDDAQRNGREAVRLATRACELTGFHHAGMLDTLAAAFAEAGDFNSAVRYQKKLLGMIRGKEATAARIRLRRYEKGLPYRSY